MCIKIYNFKGSKKYDGMSLILILRKFTEMGPFFPSLKAHNLVKDLGFRYGIPKSP